MWCKFEEENYFHQLLGLLLLLLLLSLRMETSKKLQSSKRVKTKPSLSFNKITQNTFFVLLIIVPIQENSTFCHENCIHYMYCWCYTYKKNFPTKIGSAWSYLFSVYPILIQKTCTLTNGEFSEFYDSITTHQDKKSQRAWWVKSNRHLKPET